MTVKKVIYYLEKLNINLNDMTIEKQTLLETILFADVKEGGTKMNNIALLKQNLKLFFERN